MDRLVGWKGSERRKPLIVNGARQVGKTWILKELGRLHFESVAYVSLDKDERARRFFEPDLDPRRIVSSLSLHLDMDIDPGRTLVVLDEIQSCPAAITSLKYFCEDAQEYHVAAAGSLLGISATHGTGFPVGKVSTLNLFPLSFTEFLCATGSGRYAELVERGDHAMMDTFSDKLKELLRTYYIVGGMPEAVNAYIGTADVRDARGVQDQILTDYTSDFAKHVPANLLARTMLAWDSIPKHLSKENKKFVFGQVRKGARAADFEESLRWLEQAGLVTKVPRVSKPGMPLKAYRDQNAFKVFMLDIGLLGAMSGLSPAAMVDGGGIFTEFKGALTEQYVCQQLVSDCGLAPYYWSAENSSGEIDFLVQDGSGVYPIEVKAEENLRAKSLRAFNERYEGMSPRRFSMSGFRDQGWMRNIPLYAIGNPGNWV
ncbi:ATP-binding protein [Collinsella sp. AK_207A]|uniref:ATP-binding protein n=1 Tax=Collinsella sp. AK_207A TaxID=2650472 RepID=UPI001D010A93|nr:ATP-binding protein [Collinsella sp. AK_207A]